jgi:hypothetical protein
MLLTLTSIKGRRIEADDGPIGHVADFLFDDRTWKVRWLVIDTGGWISGQKILLHPSVIIPADDGHGPVGVHLTKSQIAASPGILSDAPVSRQMQDQVYGYYGWDPLWGNGNYFGGYPYGMGYPLAPMYTPGRLYDEGAALQADREATRLDDADPHLRSAVEVIGYHMAAKDGSVGHVQDFVTETSNWGLRYLIIDTRNWWPGNRVLLSPYAVKSINWADQQVLTDVTREQVKGSPPWEPAHPVDRDYEVRLHGYYNWPGYGW